MAAGKQLKPLRNTPSNLSTYEFLKKTKSCFGYQAEMKIFTLLRTEWSRVRGETDPYSYESIHSATN